MMCDPEKLEAMVDGELDDGHLAECAVCRDEAERLRDFSGRVALAVRAYGNAIEVPPFARRRRMAWPAVAAAAAVLLAIGALLWPRSDGRLDALAERASAIDGDAMIPVAMYLADIEGVDRRAWFAGSAEPKDARERLYRTAGLRIQGEPAPPVKIVEYRQTTSRAGVESLFTFTQWDTGAIEIAWEESGPDGSRSQSLSASSLDALRGAHLDLLKRFELVGEGGDVLVGLPFERPDARGIGIEYVAGRDLELDGTLEDLYASRLARRVADRADFDARLAEFRAAFGASKDPVGRLDVFLSRWSALAP